MSLSSHERRVLAALEDDLRAQDPGLASRLAHLDSGRRPYRFRSSRAEVSRPHGIGPLSLWGLVIVTLIWALLGAPGDPTSCPEAADWGCPATARAADAPTD